MLGLQISFLCTEFDLNKVEDIKNIRNPSHKPYGGLWCSSYSQDYISDWFRYCKKEGLGICGERNLEKIKGHLIEVDENTRIYKVETEQDWIDFIEKYHLKVKSILSDEAYDLFIDYEKLAKEYDVLHIQNQKVTRYLNSSDIPSFEGLEFHWFPNHVYFDAESSLILNKEVIRYKGSPILYIKDFPYYQS